jgi:hypothetical protein
MENIFCSRLYLPSRSIFDGTGTNYRAIMKKMKISQVDHREQSFQFEHIFRDANGLSYESGNRNTRVLTHCPAVTASQ